MDSESNITEIYLTDPSFLPKTQPYRPFLKLRLPNLTRSSTFQGYQQHLFEPDQQSIDQKKMVIQQRVDLRKRKQNLLHKRFYLKNKRKQIHSSIAVNQPIEQAKQFKAYQRVTSEIVRKDYSRKSAGKHKFYY